MCTQTCIPASASKLMTGSPAAGTLRAVMLTTEAHVQLCLPWKLATGSMALASSRTGVRMLMMLSGMTATVRPAKSAAGLQQSYHSSTACTATQLLPPSRRIGSTAQHGFKADDLSGLA